MESFFKYKHRTICDNGNIFFKKCIITSSIGLHLRKGQKVNLIEYTKQNDDYIIYCILCDTVKIKL